MEIQSFLINFINPIGQHDDRVLISFETKNKVFITPKYATAGLSKMV